MPIYAGDVINDVAVTLQDSGKTRWLQADLLRYLNNGQREVAMAKPDASSAIQTVALVAGTLQSIPTLGVKLLDVTRNMGSGATPGRAIRMIDRENLDTCLPDWHASTPDKIIQHYMIDWRTPRNFYVYPPAKVPSSVEAVFSVLPTDCTGDQSLLSINEMYINALKNFMLFEAYSREAEYAGPDGLAEKHYKLFAAQVGIKASADKIAAPNSVNQSNPNARI